MKIFRLTLIMFFLLILILISLKISDNTGQDKTEISQASAKILDDRIYISLNNEDEVLIEKSKYGDFIAYRLLKISSNSLWFIIIKQRNLNEVYRYDLLSKEKILKYKIETPNHYSISMSPDEKSIVYHDYYNAYIVSENYEGKIITWDALDLGIGGPGCDGFFYSPNSENFGFCKTSAVGVTIQGQLYIFNLSGNLIDTINTNIVPSFPGIVWGIFLDDHTILFQDDEESKVFKYDLRTKKKELYYEDKIAVNVAISKDSKYLILINYNYQDNWREVVTYFEIGTKKISLEKPSDLVEDESYSKDYSLNQKISFTNFNK